MRRRILTVAVVTTAVAIVVFGVPLALAVQRLVISGERTQMEALALRSATAVSQDALTGTDPIELPSTQPGVELGVYVPGPRRVSGTGANAGDPVVTAALRGGITSRERAGQLVVAVPVSSGERVIGAVRAATSTSGVNRQVTLAWLAMTALAGISVLVASGLAIDQTRRLTRPLDRLTAQAAGLGEGNFVRRSQPASIPEIDRAGSALDRTAERLGELVARERAFNTHASHQLRTPLTAIRLRLESAMNDEETLQVAAREVIAATEHMSRTIDDLLTLSRGDRTGNHPLDLAQLSADLVETWTGPLALNDRPLRVRRDDAPDSRADMAAVRQILMVLLDNARRHGRGAVVVTFRDTGAALAIDVADEGDSRRLAVGQHDSGIGLGLARDLAGSQGGRLVHTGRSPTTFTLYLPAVSTTRTQRPADDLPAAGTATAGSDDRRDERA